MGHAFTAAKVASLPDLSKQKIMGQDKVTNRQKWVCFFIGKSTGMQTRQLKH
jgi:hypothetical protein